MERYCAKCNRFMGEGGQLRLGAAIVCKECYAQLLTADDMAQAVRVQARYEPDVVKDLMGMFGKKP